MYSNNNRKTENYKVTLLLTGGIDGKGQEYAMESLIDIINEIPFHKISIPLTIKKSFMYDNDSKGNMNIGFITGYDEEENKISAVIFGGKNLDRIKDIVRNGAVIYPAVSLNRGEDNEEKTVRTIIGFSLIED